MPSLGSARVWLSLRRTTHFPPRSFRVSYSSSIIAKPTRRLPRREFSIMAHPPSDFFEYTSGRWMFNDELRHAERKCIFKVDELSRLAAEAVNRSPDDIVRLEKLAEGGFNRTFLITMRCGFRMVARIPYPVTIPKYFAVASEVATMDLLRSFGLPIPEVYGYSPTPNNAAGIEYMFIEFVQGTNLSDIWFDLGEGEIISISRQLAELESKMMSLVFPAGGSLYYTADLENAAGSVSCPTRPGITLKDKRFSVGPDTSVRLWYGRRSQLDLHRGPYESAEAALRVRRDAYNYQKQLPSDHIENLNRYLLMASSLVPKIPALGHFRIRRPDLQPSNIIVSRSPDSNLHIVGLIDWQHTSILPLFLLAGIPQQIQNYDDRGGSQSTTQHSLPELELHRRRLVHHHYVENTKEYNKRHYAALTDPMGVLRHRLFSHASEPWEGETLALKVALIQATKNWKTLTEGGPPCPVVFDLDDVRETMRLDAKQQAADDSLEACRDVINFGQEGWVPVEHYEEAMAISRKLKEGGLAESESEEEYAEIAEHWPFDNMDEEEYN